MRAPLLALAALACLSLACGPKATPAPAPGPGTGASGRPHSAVIEMEKGGTIELELFPDIAPKHVESFVSLAQKGFYNGLSFHRVIAGFMAQGGDPAGNGSGGPGYNVPAEFSDRPHLRGTLAMARRGDDINSAGSQFYICFAPQPSLDRQYTVFGQVTKGMEVVDQIKIGDKMRTVNAWR